MRDYDYSMDMWSAGCMFAGMVRLRGVCSRAYHLVGQIFMTHPFFQGCSNDDQLLKITEVLGWDALSSYLTDYDLVLPARYNQVVFGCVLIAFYVILTGQALQKGQLPRVHHGPFQAAVHVGVARFAR